ncbi:carotenoid oxygenase [Umbelopsis sp. AD052]|nr:carotenoid oxygenase [Umbelopsis sp. AD052]
MTINDTQEDLLPISQGFQTQPQVLNPVECKVIGKIPNYVQGALYRAGPGTMHVDQVDGKRYETQHWFDGLAQIHRFEIENEKVTYRSRNTATAVEEKIRQGESRGNSFAQDVCQVVFSKSSTVMKESRKEDLNPLEMTNVSVVVAVDYPGVQNPDVVTILTDHVKIQNLDWKTLEPQSLYTYEKFNPKFAGVLSAAHPSVDAAKKETWQFTTVFGPRSGYNVFTISDENPEGELVEFVEAPPAYIHSSFITEHYYVLAVPPLYVNGMELMQKHNVAQSLHFDESAGCVFYVFDRAARKHVATYQAPSFFFFHSINSFERDGDLILDVVGYNDGSIVQALYFANLRKKIPYLEKAAPQHTRRYVLSDIASVESPKNILQATFSTLAKGVYPELPRINDSYFAKPYTYYYAINLNDPTAINAYIANSLSKVNVKTEDYWVWKEEHCLPGEPIFIANPEGTEEDDGVLLSVVLDEAKGASFLLVLDAKTMKEIARAETNSVVPFGFHGAFKA